MQKLLLTLTPFIFMMNSLWQTDYSVNDQFSISSSDWERTSRQGDSCINFKDVDPTSRFAVGDMISSCGFDGRFETFFFGNGDPFNNGEASFEDFQGMPTLFMGNTTVAFQFNPPLTGLKFSYADFGGNVNLVINGTLLNSDDFSDFDGLVVAGVQIDASMPGMVILTGAINSIGIGGQELFLIEICPRQGENPPPTDPPPGGKKCKCVNFKDVDPQSTFGLGDVIESCHLRGIFRPFFFVDGSQSQGGRAVFRPFGNPTMPTLFISNITLFFEFDHPLSELKFTYADLGGSINLVINGELVTAEDFTDLDGKVVDGVQIDASMPGMVILTGHILNVGIGGQELFLIEVCPRKKKKERNPDQCPSFCKEGNTFLGFESGISNTSGFNNSFFGRAAGLANTTGNNNSFFGHESGANNTTGRDNSFFGKSAGTSNTTGFNNVFFGTFTGENNTTGRNNTFFGNSTGRANTIGINNVFFGRSAGNSNVDGSENTYFGFSAGGNNVSGSGNVFLGSRAGQNEQGSNLLYIHNNNSQNPLVKGNFQARNFGINGDFSVRNNVSFPGIGSGTGQNLVIDGSGNVLIDNSMALENAELKVKVANLEERLAELEALIKGKGNQAEAISAKLFQNVPNPFDGTTEIGFFIPEATRQATLYIYDLQGSEIKKIALNQRGEASILLQAGTLKSGMYHYALYVDGKEIEMRRLMITD